MRVIGIIPARMGSGRLPGKPLKSICGLSMVGHCLRRTELCSGLTRVMVATPNQEIVDHVESLGGEAILTPEFDMANDRVAWAYNKVSETDGDYDIVINMQGDQPLIYPQMIQAVIDGMQNSPQFPSATLVEPCTSMEELRDLNRVKVLFRERDNGLIYMSRAPVPGSKHKDILPPRAYKHVAVMAFKPDFLKAFLEYGIVQSEEIEGIDFNRIIEMGEQMLVLPTDIVTETVDTSSDLTRVTQMMETDELWLSGQYN